MSSYYSITIRRRDPKDLPEKSEIKQWLKEHMENWCIGYESAGQLPKGEYNHFQIFGASSMRQDNLTRSLHSTFKSPLDEIEKKRAVCVRKFKRSSPISNGYNYVRKEGNYEECLPIGDPKFDTLLKATNDSSNKASKVLADLRAAELRVEKLRVKLNLIRNNDVMLSDPDSE